MAPRDPQQILQKLEQTTLRVDSYFLRQTGFIANQTVLRLGEYNLNCVPATLGVSQATFLAVLTPSEVSLFSRYKEGTHILILTFDNPDASDIARFPLRVGLLDLQPIPERKNVCLLTLKLKSLPSELILFLGSYLDDLEARLEAWHALADQALPFEPERVTAAGLGYGAVLSVGDERTSVSLQQFSTTKLVVALPEGTAAPPDGASVQLRLVFQGRPLILDGRWQAGALMPEFHPDWLDFVEEVRFQYQLRQRGGS